MAAYTIYDLFRQLIENSNWRNEEDKRAALDSVQEYQNLNMFGGMTLQLQCEHEEDKIVDGVCECGRRIIQQQLPPQWYERTMHGKPTSWPNPKGW